MCAFVAVHCFRLQQHKGPESVGMATCSAVSASYVEPTANCLGAVALPRYPPALRMWLVGLQERETALCHTICESRQLMSGVAMT